MPEVNSPASASPSMLAGMNPPPPEGGGEMSGRVPGSGSPDQAQAGSQPDQRSDTTLDGGGAAGDGTILSDSHQEPPNRFGVHPFRTKADRVESRHGRAPDAQHHRVTGGVLARRRGQT